MSETGSTSPSATLGDKNLSTIHAVAQSLVNAAAHAAEHHGVPPLDETLDYGPAS